MDQIAGTGPLHVFLTVCPLAQCCSQTVLPKVAYVTLSLSYWSVLRAGMVFQPISVSIRKMVSCVWPYPLCVCVCPQEHLWQYVTQILGTASLQSLQQLVKLSHKMFKLAFQ